MCQCEYVSIGEEVCVISFHSSQQQKTTRFIQITLIIIKNNYLGYSQNRTIGIGNNRKATPFSIFFISILLNS